MGYCRIILRLPSVEVNIASTVTQTWIFPLNRGVDFYFEFLPAKYRGVDFYFEFLPAKSSKLTSRHFAIKMTDLMFNATVLSTVASAALLATPLFCGRHGLYDFLLERDGCFGNYFHRPTERERRRRKRKNGDSMTLRKRRRLRQSIPSKPNEGVRR